MEKYISLIQEINASIAEFNTYLKDGVSLLDEDELDNKDCYMDLTNFSWDTDEWMNSGKKGVYLIFGVNSETPNNLGLYIGKASMNSYFGNRLHSHLYPSKRKPHHLMGKPEYRMELITTIIIEEKKVFLALALEEFLIKQLKDKLHLINKTGK